jgi:hypothetical protein
MAKTGTRTYELNVFSDLAEKIPKLAIAIKKRLVEETFKEIVQNSPFANGSYIASHRIALNVPDESDTKYGKGATTEAQVKVEALNTELPKLANLTDEDDIWISNNVGQGGGYSYARNIEYVGWTGRAPYLIYAKAAQKINSDAGRIIAEVEREVLQNG